jgi:hypothetical protein
MMDVLNTIKAWFTRARLLWSLAVVVVGGTSAALGHCHAWATMEPRIGAVEVRSLATERRVSRVERGL